VKRSVVVAFLCLGTFPPGAFAAEFAATGKISSSVAASDNYFLTDSPSGYTVRPQSNIDLDFLALTPTARYSLDSNIGYYKYLGPGAKDTQLSWGTPAGSTFSADFYRPSAKYNFQAQWSRSDVATTLLQQTGTATGRGSIDNYKASAGATRDFNAVDSGIWGGNISTASYSDPNQSPYIDYATNLGWNHKMSPSTTLLASVNFDWLAVDNPQDSQRLFWNPAVSLQSHLTKRLFLNATVGGAFVNAYQHGLIAPGAGAGTFQQQAGASVDWVANAVLSYNWLKDTRVSFTAVRSITPTVLGQLEKVESLGANVNYGINHSDNLNLYTQFSHNSSIGVTSTQSDAFTASASYQHQIAREWLSSLAYSYSQRSDQSGIARSNTVTLTLTHDFTLFGKPSRAVPKTASELAREDLQRAQLVLPTITP